MESKKLQQMQQANLHLAPQPMPQTKAPTFHPNTGDYRPAHSPVFQNYPQYHNLAPNFAQLKVSNQQPGQARYHQSSQQQHHLPQSQGNNHLHVKPLHGNHGLIYNYPQHEQPQQISPQYTSEQLYQNRERLYQQSGLRSNTAPHHPHSHSLSAFQQQYQELQQAKIQQQIQTQNEAIIQQQRTFALRQKINPPIPQAHYHMQQNVVQQVPQHFQQQQQQQQQQLQQQQQQQQQQSLRSAPPSTLHLTNQFQPASGPLKIIQNQNDGFNIYGSSPNQQNTSQFQKTLQQNQQAQQQILLQKMNIKSPSEQTPIIQQNHPGLVVNQACQTQISGTVSKSKTPTESPVHPPLDRKKSSGTTSLKSPITKRPTTAPVTLSGWLYKQGSDGLKVWRKRWFVLSEYCLFYYKGPEEEKLLGSILLPSYRVAACSPEDKIYRKYAFKCEHQNMRTYWLAAETQESMGQWIRALTAATMMQGSSESSDQTSQPSVSSLNPSGENSDSGIHTFQSQQSKLSAMPSHGPVTPISDGGGNSGLQPLYANAPPKPRRANDGGYSSPSPENSIERYEGNYESKAQSEIYGQQSRTVKSPMTNDPIYESRNTNPFITRQNVKSPVPSGSLRVQTNINRSQTKSPYLEQSGGSQDVQNLYNTQPYHLNKDNTIRTPQNIDNYHSRSYEQDDAEMYMQNLIAQKYPEVVTNMQPNLISAERRTPDTYGRSRSDLPMRNFSDYEDIYHMGHHINQPESAAYRRPMSPPSYNNNKFMPKMPERYTPNHLDVQNQNVQQVSMRARPAQPIPRPHSADFLEYEARHRVDTSHINPEAIRTPRPKSSLDINRTPDNFYYSEASYAEKMRQSASYLQKPLQHTPNKMYNQFLSPENTVRSGHTGSNTVPRENDFERTNRLQMENFNSREMSSSVPRSHRPYSRSTAFQQQEQFLRSASARLPRKDDESGTRDGERKREESMKRLLEWKQKMLQSPLTRKGVPISIAMDATSPLCQQNTQLQQGIQRSRSETHANSGYNSYSSDDEDEAQISPAGRSSPTSSRLPSPSLVDMVPSQINEQPKSNAKALSTLILDKDTYVPVYRQKSVTESMSPLSEKESINVNDSGASSDSTGSTLKNQFVNGELCDNEIAVETCQKPDECIITTDGIKSSDDDQSIEYTDDDLIEALQSDHPNQIEDVIGNDDEPKTPTNTNTLTDDVELTEGHYMPMTPKKPILSLSESNIFTSIKTTDLSEIDESAYVEMTRNGLATSILADDYKSDYDLVCINSSHKRTESEPVYMELSQLKNATTHKKIESVINNGKATIKKSTLKKYSEVKKKQKKVINLPDILKPSQNVLANSDSSDADDESAQDHELRSRSRFSLSDTFRPASYYLGATTPLAEFPDSSDSEIVSPPPIPASPPPMEELKTEEIFSSENYDTVKRRNDKGGLNLSYDQIPKIHSSSSSLNSIKKDNIKTSRLSLPDQFTKQKISQSKSESNESDYGFLNAFGTTTKLPSESSYSYTTDNSSIGSSDYDLYNKVKMQSPSISSSQHPSSTPSPSRYQTAESESESVELRPNSQELHERQMKRRPLSEDSFSEIESMGEKFEENIVNSDLDSYLSKLQTGDIYPYQNSDISWINESKLYDIPFIKPPEVFRSENDEVYYKNINFITNQNDDTNLEENQKSVDIDNKFLLGELVSSTNVVRSSSSLSNSNGTYYDSLEDKPDSMKQVATGQTPTFSPLKEQNLSIHDRQCAEEDMINSLNADVSQSSVDMDQTSVFELIQPAPAHSRNNSNISDQSAPYYYSDLNAKISDSMPTDDDVVEAQIIPKLNNQRDVGQKRTGISHIQNPINRSMAESSKSLASEARSISVEILNVTEKDRSIDRKNLFESELKMEKNVCKELSSGYAGNKLYGKRDCSKISHNKNDNRLNVNHGNNGQKVESQNIYQSPIEIQRKLSSCSAQPHNSNMEFSGDILWEEDSIWRERLRRVSHRHARSLDALDRIDGPSTSIRAQMADKNWEIKPPILTKPLQPIKNDYVNVNVPQSAPQSNKMKNRFSEPIQRNVETNTNTMNSEDDDVYVQLTVDQSTDVYDRLREVNLPHSRKSMEMNREIIRQWDSMSSGLMKSGGANGKIGVGLTKTDQGHKVDVAAETQSSTSSNKMVRTHSSKSYHVV